MKYKIYTKCSDGRHLIAEGDSRAVEQFRETCRNIEVEEVPCIEVSPMDILQLKSSLDYTRAIADYHGAF